MTSTAAITSLSLDATKATSSAETRPATSGCPLHRLFGPRVDPPTPLAGRIALFAYGLLAYAMFFGTILYAIGFVSNLVVPKGIDDGPAGPIGAAIAVNAGILALFVLQHTVMARPGFKRWWTRIVPESIERSTFVIAASAILIALFVFWRPLPAVVWHVETPWLRAAIHTIAFLGWGIVFASSFMVSHWDLFGLRQVAYRLADRPYRPLEFRIRGLYRLVRHPLMLGFLIAFWFAPTMTAGHLLFAVLTTAYILFGTAIEERDLVAHFGERYLAYRRAVPGIVPFLRRRTNA